MAGLSANGHLELFSHVCVKPKKVSEQGVYERAIELTSLGTSLQALVAPGDAVFIEEPPAAGAKNLRTFLKLGQVAGAAAVGAANAAAVAFVPVDTWKKDVIGRGGTSKDDVARWLQCAYPGYATQCGTDQNLIDATCLAVYGRIIRATAAGNLDQPQPGLAAC